MNLTSATYRRAGLFLLALALVDGIILTVHIYPIQLAAQLILLFILPGWSWMAGLNWLNTDDGPIRVALAGGTGAAVSAMAMLGAVYWPGPLTQSITLIALNGVSLAGLLLAIITGGINNSQRISWPDKRTLLVLGVILAVAAFYRFYALGYGEFHEDELENMRSIVQAMKGEEFAPFLDSKGPIHWLHPAAMWLMTGWNTEAMARLTVAVCSLFTVVAVFSLGQIMANTTVGLIAAATVAVNGFFIAYARHVENPSLIVLWGVLAAWCAYRYYKTGDGPPLLAGSFLMAVGLIAHPDVLLYLPPFGLAVAVRIWQYRSQLRRQWYWPAGALALFAVLTAVFYIPYFGDPSLARTAEYFASERIGTQFLYNSLPTMADQNKLYSTRYYGPFLIFFSGWVVALQAVAHKRRGVLWMLVLAAAAVLTLVRPDWWQWGQINGAFLPYALALATITFWPQTPFEIKNLSWWFGVPFLALEFLAKDAADHIQIAYPAWSVLAAMGFIHYWQAIKPRSLRWLKPVTVAMLALVGGLMFYYQFIEFLGPVTTYYRLENDAKYNPNSIFKILYGSLPRPRKLFSNPRLGGWKVVGMLYNQGVLQGDFRSVDESFAVPIWYTYQTPRSCYTDPQNYFVSLKGRTPPDEVQTLPQQGYALTGVVTIDNHYPIMNIYQKNVPAPAQPAIYNLQDYQTVFDRTATPASYIQKSTGTNPISLNFDNKLQLVGYDINQTTFEPGQMIELSLYWQGLSLMDTRYRVFIHVETDRIWGQHDDDPACRLRTDEWRPPQLGRGQFRITLDPTIPPGTYPLVIGLYNPETGQRLEITDNRGQPNSSTFELLKIEVKSPR